jgi:hypothetical protein
MSANPANPEDVPEQILAARNLVRSTLIILVAQAMGAGIAVGGAAVLFKLPVRKMLVPYVLLLWCGPVLSSLLTWARPARPRPKTYAFRIAASVFAYLVMLVLAGVFSAVWLGIVSQTDAFTRFLPPLVNLAALLSVASYFVLRKALPAK